MLLSPSATHVGLELKVVICVFAVDAWNGVVLSSATCVPLLPPPFRRLRIRLPLGMPPPLCLLVTMLLALVVPTMPMHARIFEYFVQISAVVDFTAEELALATHRVVEV